MQNGGDSRTALMNGVVASGHENGFNGNGTGMQDSSYSSMTSSGLMSKSVPADPELRMGDGDFRPTQKDVEILQEQLAKATQATQMAETEMARYKEELDRAKNGQEKLREEVGMLKTQIMHSEQVAAQNSAHLQRLQGI